MGVLHDYVDTLDKTSVLSSSPTLKKLKTAPSTNEVLLGDEIGCGTYGSIFKCRRRPDTIVVKVSKCNSDVLDVPTPFLREIVALWALERQGGHPNVVRGFEFDIPRRAFCMERYSESLFHRLQRIGNVDKKDAEDALLQISQGIAFMHSRGFVHRDLSSNNVLVKSGLSMSTTYVVSDLGTAIHAITGRLMTIGVTTLPFRAPEMFFGSHNYSKPIDIWALGILLLEMRKGANFIYRINEREQLFRIFFIAGFPTQENWPDASKLPSYLKFTPITLADLKMDKDTEYLVRWILTLDPSKRPDADAVVNNLLRDNHNDSYMPIQTAMCSRTSFLGRSQLLGWSTENYYCRSGDTRLHALVHRVSVVDFMVSVAYDMDLSRLVLHTSVALLDAYVASSYQHPHKSRLTEIAIACLMVATKLYHSEDIPGKRFYDSFDALTNINEFILTEVEIVSLIDNDHTSFDTVLHHIDPGAVAKSVKTDADTLQGFLTDLTLLSFGVDKKSIGESILRSRTTLCESFRQLANITPKCRQIVLGHDGVLAAGMRRFYND